MFSEYTLAMYQ